MLLIMAAQKMNQALDGHRAVTLEDTPPLQLILIEILDHLNRYAARLAECRKNLGRKSIRVVRCFASG